MGNFSWNKKAISEQSEPITFFTLKKCVVNVAKLSLISLL